MALYLVTGCAGFIGSHLTRKLLDQGHSVVGVDNVNDYYDPKLKRARLEWFSSNSKFSFVEKNVQDHAAINALFKQHRFDKVVHLAAQAGVRYSLENPYAYVDSNITGTLALLEACRHHSVSHFIYASTSSVYGLNRDLPFRVTEPVDHPVSFYGVTKRANELMAHSYSHLFGLPTTGLRFFTVYGPWGRPDMALFIFTKNILAGKPIQLFNKGQHKRDFTYVDDIVEGLCKVVAANPPSKNASDPLDRTSTSIAPFRIYNIGNSNSVNLSEYVEAIEKRLGKKAIIELLPMQAGDIEATLADVSDLERDFGYRPSTSVADGVGRFVDWYRKYYQV